MYLSIYNSDGDTLTSIHDQYPTEYQDGSYMISEGAAAVELLRDECDSNYWPEDTVVILELKEPKREPNVGDMLGMNVKPEPVHWDGPHG